MEVYIPPKFRNIFKFEEFNSVQSALCDEIFYSSRSLVVSAPTGCGKTVIFELNLIKYLVDCEKSTTRSSSCVVYIAPLKSLCHEKFTEWQLKFSPTDLKCIMYTGDSEHVDKDQLAKMALIVTTPEKLDFLTKSSDEELQLLPLVQYCFVDEIHLLRDPERGPLLEALVTRIKAISNPRFVCVSATMANSEDLATWLSVPSRGAVFYNFGNEFRPGMVHKIVLGFYRQKSQSIFQFDSVLNYKLASVIASYSENKPVLIFCTTRRGTVQVARDLTKNNHFKTGPMFDKMRSAFAAKIKDPQLRDVLKSGVGYHHAGLDADDRRVVEQAFISGCLPILASTSTLSMGMNLPAHLVIIKNTEQLINGQLVGYSSTQISQMVGRAGRPQFDSNGIAVVMTSSDMKTHYEALLHQNDDIESCLRTKLSEYMNTEIALGVITNLSESINWLKSTFLYVRIKKEPRLYGVPFEERPNCADFYVQDLCMTEIKNLQSLGLVEFNETKSSLMTTALGKLMMRNNMEFTTMRMIWELNGTESLEDLVHFVGCCSELSDISLRNNEKVQLNNLNRARGRHALRYPLNGRISTAPMKIVCLLQAKLGGVPLADFSLENETRRICRCAKRIVNGLAGLLWLDLDDPDSPEEQPSTVKLDTTAPVPTASSAFKCMINILEFKKTLQFLAWMNQPIASLLNLQHLGAPDIEKLMLAGLMTLHSIENTSPSELERILEKRPPFGEQLVDSVRLIPKYILEMEQINRFNRRWV
ncbi:hypothetical protein CRM22_008320 [Opisthorchis felineus]|uniref:DNA 3'-5' helicase n=1 Tax=Opisthorchis felineus TaxID=147828 RepID=A0A4S2LDT1_OPIFE|nr:hypothetical protein CRM22_008320 [Opisthorchis felineus]